MFGYAFTGNEGQTVIDRISELEAGERIRKYGFNPSTHKTRNHMFNTFTTPSEIVGSDNEGISIAFESVFLIEGFVNSCHDPFAVFFRING